MPESFDIRTVPGVLTYAADVVTVTWIVVVNLPYFDTQASGSFSWHCSEGEMEEREVRWAAAPLKLAPEAFLALGFTRISRLVVPRGMEMMYRIKQHMYV